nr:redoxin domain-containing protein [Prevotella sp. KH2C16]
MKKQRFFLYPADFTFVCPAELEDLADYCGQPKSMGVEVIFFDTN